MLPGLALKSFAKDRGGMRNVAIVYEKKRYAQSSCARPVGVVVVADHERTFSVGTEDPQGRIEQGRMRLPDDGARCFGAACANGCQ